MQVEVITKEDLQAFRKELLNDFKQFIISIQGDQKKKWLKGNEVRKMLKISAGTLQNLRVKGLLNPSKIGGSFYYAYHEIESLLNNDNSI